MKLKKTLYPIFLLVFLQLFQGCHRPVFEIAPGQREVQFFHDQHLRTSDFFIPKKLKRKNRSLVLCLHNEGESAASMARTTRRSFEKLAEKDGFVVGYPEAVNGYWNDGRQDSISLSHYNQVDDVGFIQKLIQYSIDSFRVDPEQIFVTGLSNGGFMSYRIACELSHQINGIAAVSAGLSLDQLVECNADTTVAMMVINGTRDPIMPFDGGEMFVDGRSQGSILSAEETIKYWLGENNCKDKSAHKDVPNTDLFDETRAERWTYSNCDNGGKIVLISIANGGHTWPGGRQYAPEKDIGRTSKDFDAAEEIWRFFKGL